MSDAASTCEWPLEFGPMVACNTGRWLGRVFTVAPAQRPVSRLLELDPRGLEPGARIDLLTLLEEQKRSLDAAANVVLAEMDRTDSLKLGLSGELVSLALRVSPRAAQTKLKTARSLVDHLPATQSLLSDGKISLRHAEVIAEKSWTLEPDGVGEFEAALIEAAPDQTVTQLRGSARRAATRLDPASAEAKHQKALKTRSVKIYPAEDGMVDLPVVLNAPDGQLIYTRLTAAAKLLPKDDPRTTDQKRADLLVDAILCGLPHDGLPEQQGRRPTIQIVVSADTLLNLDDEPAHLTGYGPITAETARRLAADQSGTWLRLLTDPDTGNLLDISADRYQPCQRLRDFVIARDDVCVFPGCNQPGYRCQYEHTIPYLQGGQTCRCNGALCCARHNICKIDTGWNYQHNNDGTFTWTTNTGHQYTSRPPTRWKQPGEQPPPEKPRPTLDDIHADGDRAYSNLINRWNLELATAEQADNTEAITNAHRAINATHRQRHHQLAHRQNPDHPPF